MKKEIHPLSLHEGYVEVIDLLKKLPGFGEDFDFVLLHCYAHIKNEEIYLEIDKDIYEHVVMYEGKNFYDAVKQYFFQLKRGAILVYHHGDFPNLKMDMFTDSFADYEKFTSECEDLLENGRHSPCFAIYSDSRKAEVITYDDRYATLLEL